MLCQVCPVCVATPGGDPNHMTDDLISHLLVDHHGSQKTEANISFQFDHNIMKLRHWKALWLCTSFTCCYSVTWPFSTLMLLVGRQESHHKHWFSNPQRFSFGSLTFFRLSAQGQVLGTNLSMFFDTVPSLIHHPIWHHGLTKAQAESLEAIQRRALRIIDSSTVGMPYEVALCLTQFVSLHDRREHLNKKFFTSITIPSSYISRLLPPLRDSSITSRLRTPSLYPRPATRTKRYTSFIHHALLNYQ